MGSLVQVPDAFRHSYMNFEAYPTNLIYTTTSTSALKEYATQLDVNEALFLARGVNYVKVPFREFTGDRGGKTIFWAIMDSNFDISRRLS